MKAALLLGILLSMAICASGWLYGLHWQSSAKNRKPDSSPELRAEIIELKELLETKDQEISVLKSLAQGGGDVPVSAELQSFIEDSIGLPFLATPKVRKASAEEIEDAVRISLARDYGSDGLAKRSYLWSLLSLIPQEQNLEGQFVALATTGSRGVLSIDSVLIAEDFDSGSIRDASALVRLLSLLLIQQHHPTPHPVTDDQLWAHQALQAGLANKPVAEFQAKQARNLGALAPAQTTDARDLLLSLPTFVQTLATFPAEFSHSYLDRSNLTPAQHLQARKILSTSHFLGKNDYPPSQLGELGLYGLLQKCLPKDFSLELSRELISDSLEYENDIARWTLNFSTKLHIKNIVDAMKTCMQETFPPSADVPEEFRRVWKIKASGKQIVLTNSPAQSQP